MNEHTNFKVELTEYGDSQSSLNTSRFERLLSLVFEREIETKFGQKNDNFFYMKKGFMWSTSQTKSRLKNVFAYTLSKTGAQV